MCKLHVCEIAVKRPGERVVTQPSLVADTLKSRYAGGVDKETLDKLMELESPVSPDNEQKLWGFLETRAALLLKSYPTSLQVCPGHPSTGPHTTHFSATLTSYPTFHRSSHHSLLCHPHILPHLPPVLTPLTSLPPSRPTPPSTGPHTTHFSALNLSLIHISEPTRRA